MISVVVPAYNAESTIAATIESVIAQSCSDWEMVVCDDGSSDNTADVVEAYKDPRIRLIRGERSGLPAVGRNRALEVAQGDHLAFLDADDIWQPSKLEGQLNFFENHPHCGLVFTRFLFIDQEGNVVSPEPIPDLGGVKNPGDLVPLLARNNVICNSSVMIPRAAFDTVGKISESPEIRGTEDFDYWLKIARQFSVGFLPTAEVRYRVHDQGISRNFCALRRGAFLVVLSQLREDAETHGEAISTRAFQWALAASAIRDREQLAEAIDALGEWEPGLGRKIQLWLSRLVPANLLQRMMS